MKWYKRDCDAALVGMAELTLAERGLYNTILDLLYSRDGDLPDDEHFLAAACRAHWRSIRALRESLIAKGKIWSDGGKLHAKRVQECLMEASQFSQKQSRNASKRWHKSENTNEINKPSMPAGNAYTTTTTATEEDTEAKASAAPPTEKGDFIAKGKKLLGTSSGGLLAKLWDQRGREASYALLESAAATHDPRQYVAGAISRGPPLSGMDQAKSEHREKWRQMYAKLDQSIAGNPGPIPSANSPRTRKAAGMGEVGGETPIWLLPDGRGF